MMTKKVAYPEMKVLEPFYYKDWDEEEIVSVIQDKLKWEKCTYSGSSWRTDCEIATFKNYLYKQTIGFSKLIELGHGKAGNIETGALLRRTVDEELGLDLLMDALDNRSNPFQFLQGRNCARAGPG